MRKPKANLYLRFRSPDRKQSPYCPALYDSKSRIRPFWCLVRGTPEHHPEATYYMRVKRVGKWTWESLGTDAHTAWCKASAGPVPTKADIAFSLQSNQPDTPAAKESKHRLDEEIREYLSNVAKLAPKTYKAYRLTLELFQQSCKRVYVHQITKQDLQAFDTFLIEQENEDRTRHNRITHVVTFLRNKEGASFWSCHRGRENHDQICRAAARGIHPAGA